MAEAGIQRAIAELQTQNAGRALKTDPWAVLGAHGDTAFAVGSDSFRLEILDESAKVNVNTADQPLLAHLPLSSDQVDALLDWREKATSPRPTGAKDEFYNVLAKPYNTKLQPLGSFDELMQIRGFTPDLLYKASTSPSLEQLVTIDSTSGDLDPEGHQKIDVRSANASQFQGIGVSAQVVGALMQSQGGFQKMGDVLKVQGMDQASAKAILNFCQLGTNPQSPGLININTASAGVLGTVPGLETDVVNAIQDRQSSGFSGLGDLVDVPGLELSNLAAVIDRLCISSRSFQARVIGSAGGIDVALQAILTLGDKGEVNIVRIQPCPFPNPAQNWNWSQEASDRVVIGGLW